MISGYDNDYDYIYIYIYIYILYIYMTGHLQANIPAGTLFIRINFPERQELLQRARINVQEYKKEKLVFLVLALTQRLVGGEVKHHCCCYVGAGPLSKDLDLILEAIKDAVTWAKGKGGVSKVISISDRCRAEFSNHNLLYFVSMHEKLLALPASWCFDMPGHGKVTCDGLGAGMKKMLGNWMSGLEGVPSPSECVQHLCRVTKSKPLRGKYATFCEYRFLEVKGKNPFPPLPPTSTVVDCTKYFASQSINKIGKVQRRRYPCWYQRCALPDPIYKKCKNVPFCGNEADCWGSR